MIKLSGSKAALSQRVQGRKTESEKSSRSARFANALKKAEVGELKRQESTADSLPAEQKPAASKGRDRSSQAFTSDSSINSARCNSPASAKIINDSDEQVLAVQLKTDVGHAESMALVWPSNSSSTARTQGDPAGVTERVLELAQLADMAGRMRSNAFGFSSTERNGLPRFQSLEKAGGASVLSLEIIGSKLGVEALHLSVTAQGLWSLRIGMKQGVRTLTNEEFDVLKSELSSRGHQVDHVSAMEMK